MNGVLDHFLVGVALFAGFGYAIYSLGPKSLRARLLRGAASLLGRLPAAGVRAAAARMAAAEAKGSCGGCDNCGSEVSVRPPQGGPDGEPGVPPEIRIPLSHIGKRDSAGRR